MIFSPRAPLLLRGGGFPILHNMNSNLPPFFLFFSLQLLVLPAPNDLPPAPTAPTSWSNGKISDLRLDGGKENKGENGKKIEVKKEVKKVTRVPVLRGVFRGMMWGGEDEEEEVESDKMVRAAFGLVRSILHVACALRVRRVGGHRTDTCVWDRIGFSYFLCRVVSCHAVCREMRSCSLAAAGGTWTTCIRMTG